MSESPVVNPAPAMAPVIPAGENVVVNPLPASGVVVPAGTPHAQPEDHKVVVTPQQIAYWISLVPPLWNVIVQKWPSLAGIGSAILVIGGILGNIAGPSNAPKQTVCPCGVQGSSTLVVTAPTKPTALVLYQTATKTVDVSSLKLGIAVTVNAGNPDGSSLSWSGTQVPLPCAVLYAGSKILDVRHVESSDDVVAFVGQRK